MTREILAKRIDAAAGRIPADTLITNIHLVNVFSGEITDTDIAIFDGIIVGLGEGYEAKEVIDGKGAYAAPGFIDSHIHIESSMVTPEEFSRLSVPFGTTTIVADPHEIVNVAGLDGFSYMKRAAEGLPLHIEYMVPSCVPATSFEHSGAVLEADELEEPLSASLGLAEYMNYPGVIGGATTDLDKLAAAISQNKPIDGHAPTIAGKELNAYLVPGILTDHECQSLEDAKERIARGMYVMLRQGSACLDLPTIAEAITKENASRFLLCSDDRQAKTFLSLGHLNNHLTILRVLGFDPVTSIRMCTLNPSQCYGMKDRGAIAPGRRADIVLLKDLHNFESSLVLSDGKVVARDGEYLAPLVRKDFSSVRNSVKTAPFTPDSFRLHLKSPRVYTIGVLPGGVVTKKSIAEVALTPDGDFCYTPGQDVAKIVVMERHHATGHIGLGLLEGYGIKKGAVALSIAHDSHNIIAVGVSNEEIAFAIDCLIHQEGGIVICEEGRILDAMPLPVAGLMSDQSGAFVADRLSHLHENAHNLLGIHRSVEPVMTLCFMSLPVIPEVKLTDMGLFDVTAFSFLDLEVND